MNPKVAALPQYHGFPIPYFATRRADGTPDFKVIDEGRRLRCAQERRCWVCGGVLGRYTAFLGGPESIKNRLFVDGPMHKDCAEDALAICPFMVGNMDYAKDLQLNRHENPPELFERADQQVPPELIGLIVSNGFDIYARRMLWGIAWFFRALPPDAQALAWTERKRRG